MRWQRSGSCRNCAHSRSRLTERARCYACPGGTAPRRCPAGLLTRFFSLEHWWEVRFLHRRVTCEPDFLDQEADIGRYKRVIGNALRSRTEGRQTTEVAIAVASLNRMVELGRPKYVRLIKG